MPIEDFTEPHYVGEENTLFYVDCGIDVSSATDVIIYLQRPDGTKIKRYGSVSTYNGSPDYVKFRVEKTDFNQAGDYSGQVYLEIGAWSGWGNPFEVRVVAPISSSSCSSSSSCRSSSSCSSSSSSKSSSSCSSSSSSSSSS